MILEIIWVTLIALHIFPFLAYILYMKHIAENKPWNIKFDPSYEPTVSIIIPTYNEATIIEKKLSNVTEVDYPKDKIDIIVVDSASIDNTLDIVQNWMKLHSEINFKLIEENKRRGMVKALNLGFESANGEMILKTDADCLSFSESLRNAMKYMADPEVGSVAGLHIIAAHKDTLAVKVEKKYRSFYRWLRIGESKLDSTVLYEGEFLLVKRYLLRKIGGFDVEMGADDVPIALKIATEGFRAISADDVYFEELTPFTWSERYNQKVRRAGHVIQALWKYKNLISLRGRPLRSIILPMELMIYVFNPMLFVPIMILSPIIVVKYPFIIIVLILLIYRDFRKLFFTHITNVSIILLALINRLSSGDKLVWQKIDEIR